MIRIFRTSIFRTSLGWNGLAAFTLLALGAVAAQAQTGYAISGDSLYTVDLSAGTAALIGNDGLSGNTLEGLAIAPSGSLFATDNAGSLYSLSDATGAATLIGSTGRGDIEGLDFFGSTLVGTDNSSSSTFFSIDTATAVTTNIIQVATGAIRGLDSTGPNSALVISDTPVFQSLQSVNLTTGAVTNIGTLQGTGKDLFFGLDFASDGNLYGLGGNGNIDRIDPATGQTTLISNANIGSGFLDFKANSPVPEASTTVSLGFLLALGGVVIATKRKKQSA
jgi:hypothetical protein